MIPCCFISVLTGDRWEVDANQESEKGCDVIDDVGKVHVFGGVPSSDRKQLPVFYQHAQVVVLRPHIFYNR